MILDARAEAYDLAVKQLKPEQAAVLALLDVPRLLALVLLGPRTLIDATNDGLVIRSFYLHAVDVLDAIGAHIDQRAVSYCGDSYARLWPWPGGAPPAPLVELHPRVTILCEVIHLASVIFSNQTALNLAAERRLPMVAAMAAQFYVTCPFARMQTRMREMQVDFMTPGVPDHDIVDALEKGGFLRMNTYLGSSWICRFPERDDDGP